MGGEVLTGGGCIGLVFSNDEGGGACRGHGLEILGVGAGTMDGRPGPSLEGSPFDLLRAWLLRDVTRVPLGL